MTAPIWKYNKSYVDGILTVTNFLTGESRRVTCLEGDIEETLETVVKEIEGDEE
jgi:hypothetical protein